jgi:hypothetical protein
MSVQAVQLAHSCLLGELPTRTEHRHTLALSVSHCESLINYLFLIQFQSRRPSWVLSWAGGDRPVCIQIILQHPTGLLWPCGFRRRFSLYICSFALLL